ncbi:MAG: POT family MFS transporter [Methylococcales symbiont of Hymedesmia sp. n. MRB-2018]|nr:MAG: POT family MFS transporter [Methylococcales symbiont of Hymedesmia sp. n. MRB-2018]KAF3984641.1 MAG: POT family MFS transporter [Methylococcales symbiont of Hymedesmia sp. n. MRB-2018]
MSKFKTAPISSNSIPSGIPYIVANEAAERFSYYGMRAILVVFMTQYLVSPSGELDVMSDNEAQGYYHLFISAVYFMPIFGALLADGLLGKYRTILFLSLFYCFGHFALALDDTRTGLLIGLALIAIGAGGIKPCVSSHVGDQFGVTNQHLLSSVFGWFYFSINLGAFAAMLLIPWLLAEYGAAVAFAAPGLLMLVATIAFWSGRYRFVHIQPSGTGFVKEVFSPFGIKVLLKLSSIYIFIAVFWALFEQTGSSWVLQAQKMDRMIFDFEVLPSQIQAANPLLIMLLIPVFNSVIYPLLNKIVVLTALKKISMGLFLTTIAFTIPALIQMQIEQGLVPSIGWQMLAYIILTAAEVMVSITCLEFSYTQAPKSMKSFIMALFFMSVALGNLFTSAVNFFIVNDDGSNMLTGAGYFWFFTVLMLITAILFIFLSQNYQEKTYLQEEQDR